jgi:hypothetical protein
LVTITAGTTKNIKLSTVTAHVQRTEAELKTMKNDFVKQANLWLGVSAKVVLLSCGDLLQDF